MFLLLFCFYFLFNFHYFKYLSKFNILKEANANLCVMIVGQENSFYLEFKSIEEKEKWLKNFNVVFEFYIK